MKVEKKIVALSILALIIGIAITLPIVYFTSVDVTVQPDPPFNVGIFYANTSQNTPFNGERITLYANFTVTSDEAILHDADAKIEVFNFHIYSDQTSIANLTCSFGIYDEVSTPNSRLGWSYSIENGGNGFWTFADGSKYDIRDVIGYTEGSTSLDLGFFHNQSLADMNYFVSGIITILSEDNGERSTQAQIDLRNAQTLYIDVTRVMTILYHHQINNDSTSSSITTTLANNEVLDHIELSKTDYGFTYGSVPDNMSPPPPGIAELDLTGPLAFIMW